MVLTLAVADKIGVPSQREQMFAGGENHSVKWRRVKDERSQDDATRAKQAE